MQDYSAVSQITVTQSYDEVNRLLKDCWILLDIFHDANGIPLFVLGDRLSFGMREFEKSLYEGVAL